MSAEMARQLALAYARRFGSGLRGPLIREHGGPIAFESLTAGDNVFFAETPYEEGGGDLHPGSRNRHGDYALVELLQDGIPALSVAVSVYSASLIGTSGAPDFSKLRGNEFYVAGIPRDGRYRLPMRPEDAVRIAFESTGRRVSGLPRLVLPGTPESPFSAMWQVQLEMPASLRLENNARYQGSELLVHPAGHLVVPDVDHRPKGIGLSRDLGREVQIPVRPAFAVRHTQVARPNK